MNTALCVLCLCLTTLAAAPVPAPPYAGTLYELSPDILTPKDPTTLIELTDQGKGNRVNFDRRADKFGPVDVWLYRATYKGGRVIEVQVNQEFSAPAARKQAERFARIIGQLPHCLRRDIDALWIHAGDKPMGGGNRSVTIHVDQANWLEKKGLLEEVFLHEASHTSLDGDHAKSAGWQAAQAKDKVAISNYARDFPQREDVAETFPAWYAVRQRRARMPFAIVKKVEQTVPARLAYLDSLKLEMSAP